MNVRNLQAGFLFPRAVDPELKVRAPIKQNSFGFRFHRPVLTSGSWRAVRFNQPVRISAAARRKAGIPQGRGHR